MAYKPKLLVLSYLLWKILSTVFSILGFNIKLTEWLHSQKAEVKLRERNCVGINLSGILELCVFYFINCQCNSVDL